MKTRCTQSQLPSLRGLFAITLLAMSACATSSAVMQESVAISAHDEVLVNIRSQPVGNHSVADYHLPEAFLRGLADRIIAESFQEQFRVVVEDLPIDEATPSEQGSSIEPKVDNAKALRIVSFAVSDEGARYRAGLQEMRPPLHGFRAVLVQDASNPWPFFAQVESAPASLRDAADIVGRRLAQDGLLCTTAQVIETIGHDRDEAEMTNALKAVGLPIDLLRFFQPVAEANDTSIATWIAKQFKAGETLQSIQTKLASVQFQFLPSHQSIAVATESGEHEMDSIRVQITRGTYWQNQGDGGSVDIVRQLATCLPDVSILASIEGKFLDDFTKTAKAWPLVRDHQLTIISAPSAVSQWAQDNGKAGFIANAEGIRTGAVLVPRFASRGEDGSIFVPGDTFVLDGVSVAGVNVIQSPLLFQGGNLLAVQHPTTQKRILFIGEAEILRNTVLGLTERQILQAFEQEFRVDACIVLPAVSFHIDYDVTFRAHDDRLVAFVNDVRAGATMTLQCAIDTLEAKELLKQEDAKIAREQIANGEWSAFMESIGQEIYSAGGRLGHFPKSFADHFRLDNQESGVGNLHRILHALDLMTALTTDVETLAVESPLHTYLKSLRRQEDARLHQIEVLQRHGMEIVPIPNLPGGRRGINYVNGVHARTANVAMYLMPAYGGMFQRIDDAAEKTFREALSCDSSIARVIPIYTAESQRRAGAVHCSCSVMYRP